MTSSAIARSEVFMAVMALIGVDIHTCRCLRLIREVKAVEILQSFNSLRLCNSSSPRYSSQSLRRPLLRPLYLVIM